MSSIIHGIERSVFYLPRRAKCKQNAIVCEYIIKVCDLMSRALILLCLYSVSVHCSLSDTNPKSNNNAMQCSGQLCCLTSVECFISIISSVLSLSLQAVIVLTVFSFSFILVFDSTPYQSFIISLQSFTHTKKETVSEREKTICLFLLFNC